MQALFYATPIIYPLSIVIDKNIDMAKLIMLSPIAQAIQDARYSLVTHETVTPTTLYGGNQLLILIPYIIVIAVMVIGALYFKKHSKYFAENI
jgi:ABC-2 type transport system permease protein